MICPLRIRTKVFSNASSKLGSAASSAAGASAAGASTVSAAAASAGTDVSTVAASSASTFSNSGLSAIVFSSSLILVITSIIIQFGVDAPPTTPIISFVSIFSSKTSSRLAIDCTCLQFFLHTAANFCVLELSCPPTTNMCVHFLLSVSTSSCRCRVSVQIV